MRNYLIKYFREKQIEFKEATNGEFILKRCPSCGDDRNHLYVSQDKGVFNCKKCNYSVNLNQFRKLLGDSTIDLSKLQGKETKFKKPEYRVLQYNIPLEYASRLWGIDTKFQKYLIEERKLNKNVLEKYKIGSNGKAISIPLYEKDTLVNIQYRRNPSLDKNEKAGPKYTHEKGCKAVLFNGDILREPIKTIYVTEGIFDALQLIQLGIRNVVSVPLGAGYFSKEWVEKLKDVSIVYLTFDNDLVGKDGAKNAANMIGVDKCKLINLPRKEGRKKTDITNYFVDDGYTKTDFLELVKNAKAITSVEEDSIKHISEFSEELRKRLLEGEHLGEKTGYKLLDEYLGGLRKGRLVVVSGLTSSGKTSFALNVCLNMAKNKLPVFYFSLEMPPIDIAKKILTLEAKLTGAELKKIDDPSEVLKRIDKTLDSFKDAVDMPIYLYKGSGVVAYKIFAECARIVKEAFGCKCIFVDHLHYFARGTHNITSETSIIVRDIKQLAIQLDIPIVLLTHLNRAGRAKQRTGLYTPSLADLRDSGCVEQDADQVLFVCRDSDNEDKATRQKAFIKISKNRDGAAGRNISMVFNEDITSFIEDNTGADYAEEAKQEQKELKGQVLNDPEKFDLPF